MFYSKFSLSYKNILELFSENDGLLQICQTVSTYTLLQHFSE